MQAAFFFLSHFEFCDASMNHCHSAKTNHIKWSAFVCMVLEGSMYESLDADIPYSKSYSENAQNKARERAKKAKTTSFVAQQPLPWRK